LQQQEIIELTQHINDTIELDVNRTSFAKDQVENRKVFHYKLNL